MSVERGEDLLPVRDVHVVHVGDGGGCSGCRPDRAAHQLLVVLLSAGGETGALQHAGVVLHDQLQHALLVLGAGHQVAGQQDVPAFHVS